MIFRLEVNMDNAAFVDEGEREELERIIVDGMFNSPAWRGEDSEEARGRLRDINGNTVGEWRIEP